MNRTGTGLQKLFLLLIIAFLCVSCGNAPKKAVSLPPLKSQAAVSAKPLPASAPSLEKSVSTAPSAAVSTAAPASALSKVPSLPPVTSVAKNAPPTSVVVKTAPSVALTPPPAVPAPVAPKPAIPAPAPAPQGPTVYVTPSGECYHYSQSCAGKNARPIGLSQAAGYRPCKKCAK